MTQKSKEVVRKNVAIEIVDSLYKYRVWGWYGDRHLMLMWAHGKFNIPASEAKSLLDFPADCFMVPLADMTGSLIHIADDEPLTNVPTLVALAHECQHVAFHVLNNRGMVYSSDSEEAYCYYASWWYEQFLTEFLKEPDARKKKKVRN